VVQDLTASELQSLADQWTDVLSDIGTCLLINGRFYLKTNALLEVTTTPLPRVVGQEMHAFLPEGRDRLLALRWMNDMQMLLHANTKVDGFWLWGGGALQVLPGASSWACVITNHRLLAEALRALGCAVVFSDVLPTALAAYRGRGPVLFVDANNLYSSEERALPAYWEACLQDKRVCRVIADQWVLTRRKRWLF